MNVVPIDPRYIAELVGVGTAYQALFYNAMAEYTRQQREQAWDEREKADPGNGHWEDCKGDCRYAKYPNPYRITEIPR